MRWVIVIALVLGVLIALLIKGGLTLETGQESAIQPGQPVETYHEQVTSEYLRAKKQIREIQKTQQEPSF